MCIADIFSTKMSRSHTFNYISSYSILKTLTSFISHCFACHQWRSRTELFAGCLPKSLLWARRFLSSLHPTCHLSFKRLSPDILLANQLRKALFMQNHSQAGWRRHAHLQGRWDRPRELWFSPVVQLTKHWTSFSVSRLWSILMAQRKHRCRCPSAPSDTLPTRGCCLDFFPSSTKFSTQKGNSRFLPSKLLDIH